MRDKKRIRERGKKVRVRDREREGKKVRVRDRERIKEREGRRLGLA